MGTCEKAPQSRAATIAVLTVSFCLTGAANSVLSKVVADTYTQRFAFFVDQGANIGYALLAAVPVVYQGLRGRIPEEAWEFPQRAFALMGFLDALATYCTSVGAVHTPGQLQTVLGQLLIPVSMLASYVVLGTRYVLQEIASSTTVFLGACIAVGPAVLSGASTGAWPPSIVIFAAGNLPSALSGVFKESAFADCELDVWLLTFTTTLYQIAFSFVLLLLQTLPYLSGSEEGMSLPKAWGDVVGGCACFVGAPPEDGRVDCSRAGLLLVAYVAVNLVFGLNGLLLLKVGSDSGIGQVLCSLASAVKLPVSTVLFACPLIMGAGAERTQPSTWAGLVFVLVGFVWHIRAAGPGDQQQALQPVMSRTFTMLGPVGPHRPFLPPLSESMPPRARTAGAIFGARSPFGGYDEGALQARLMKVPSASF